VVKLNLDGVDYLCTNTANPNACKYQQTASSFPVVVTASISADHMSIVLTGLRFTTSLLAASWTPLCGFAGVYTDKVV
jgi:hypothetical protein